MSQKINGLLKFRGLKGGFMPVYEYKCSDCNKKFEILHRTSTNVSDITCPECKSENVKKMVSTFASTNHNVSMSFTDPSYSDKSFNSGGGCSGGSCSCC